MQTGRICRYGPFDIRRVRDFGIDTDSILGALTPCRPEDSVTTKFCVGRFGIAIDTFGLPSVSSSTMIGNLRKTKRGLPSNRG